MGEFRHPKIKQIAAELLFEATNVRDKRLADVLCHAAKKINGLSTQCHELTKILVAILKCKGGAVVPKKVFDSVSSEDQLVCKIDGRTGDVTIFLSGDGSLFRRQTSTRTP